MKYIFPLIRNIESESGNTGYPLRIESVGEDVSEAIRKAITALELKPKDDDYEGTKYQEVYDSFSLDTSKTVKPYLLEDKQ